ncbi:hypothetical protein Q7P37_001352 [Cladosporium fusiforme]
MRANESLVLSLLSAAAVAMPAAAGEHKAAACPAKAHKEPARDTSNDHVASLRDQVSSLRQELQSVYNSPSQACRAHAPGTKYGAVPTGSFTGAFTVAYSTGAPSATKHAEVAGPISRLTPTSVRSYPAGPDGAAPTGVGKDDDKDGSKGEGESSGKPSAPVDGDNESYPSGVSTGSSGASSEAPFPTASSYTNGTMTHSATSGVISSSSVLLSTGVSEASTSSAASSSAVSESATSSSTTSSGVSPTYIPKLSDFTDAEIQNGDAWKNVSSIADERMKARDLEGSCTYENAAVRTEFRAMSNEQRKEFTDAITCLQNMPPQSLTADDAAEFPGVKSRYDEYVATHIENTLKIHATADFLAWHRHYIWSFEQDLKNSCGYTGTLPYWDWAADAEALHESEVFNGDEYSMGSNGEYIAGRSDTYLGLQDINFPPGTGGGCVHSGPFSNGTGYSTNLGPIASPYDNNVQNHFDYNPRCLVRDLNSWFSSRYNTYTNVADLVIGEDTVQYFQALMQGYLGDNKLGVHGGGHWLGGGPSQLEDFFSSPSDPIFYLHHAMIDRIWTVWQYMDRETRQDAIYGTSTLNNDPPSADMTLQDNLPFNLVASDPVLGDLMDTLAGPYCYRYE